MQKASMQLAQTAAFTPQQPKDVVPEGSCSHFRHIASKHCSRSAHQVLRTHMQCLTPCRQTWADICCIMHRECLQEVLDGLDASPCLVLQVRHTRLCPSLTARAQLPAAVVCWYTVLKVMMSMHAGASRRWQDDGGPPCTAAARPGVPLGRPAHPGVCALLLLSHCSAALAALNVPAHTSTPCAHIQSSTVL